MVALGAIGSAASGEARPLVGGLVFAAVVAAVIVPLELMQRSGRGVAAPMGTTESRRSMVAFSSILGLAAGLGAVWALSSDHVGLGVALGVFVVLALVGLGAALLGPAESRRGLRPGEQPR